MNTVIVATDGSEGGRAAVAAALDLAADERARLVIAHVVSVLDFAPSVNGNAATPPQRVPRADEDPVLREAMQLAEARGLSASAELLVGYPPKQIVRLAADLGADVIVVGSRSLGRVKSAFLGSTSRYVLAHADRPVLVVPSAAAHAPAPA